MFDSLQATLRDEVLRAIFHVRSTDAISRESIDDDHETELTKLAENSVEHGVNEITGGEENRDGDFTKSSVKRAASTADTNRKRNAARKKKKAQRQNRKKKR